MTPEQRVALRAHVLGTLIAGDTKTSRRNAVENAVKLAEGDPDKALGIGARGKSPAEVLACVAALCGCSPALEEMEGPGVIDPDRVVDGVAAMAARLGAAARRGERMLIATGHPTGLMPMYQAVARALASAGVKVLTPHEDIPLEPPTKMRRMRRIIYLDGVAVLATGGDLLHTHWSWPMDVLLERAGGVDLVLADHGFAGAAIQRGIETVCFTDVNDPAIAVAKADGMVDIVVPCDDNLPPSTYDPIRDVLIEAIRG